MAEKEAQDRAAKTRIVSHMNNDHHDSVVRYLRRFANVSFFSAWDGKITDITLDSMTLSCQGRTYRVPFESPMASYREARERLVELDRDCRKALGHSDVTIKAYLPPTGLYAIPFLAVTATFLGYSQRWWFAGNGPVEKILGAAFARFSFAIQPWLLGAMFLIHSMELLYFATRKLTAHSVSPRSRIWWLWAMSAFIEGQFAFYRFDQLVVHQREKQKH